jgi:hypothetical protein
MAPPSLIPAFGQVGISGRCAGRPVVHPQAKWAKGTDTSIKGTDASSFGRAERSSPTAA